MRDDRGFQEAVIEIAATAERPEPALRVREVADQILGTRDLVLRRIGIALQAEHEIARTQDQIGDLAHPQRWFRPFGGGGNLDDRLLKPSVVDHLSTGGYSCVLWNSIPRDWDDPEGWTDLALAQCRAQAWSLMVLHDLPTG